MRTSHLGGAFVSVVAAALFGCGDGSSPTAPRIAQTGSGTALAQSGGAMVTGSGHVPVGMTDDLREFTFHAIEHQDGTVSGSYKIERTDTGAYFVVQVTCLAVVGNTGWVAGIISETNAPGVSVGTVSYFWARDNGEGDGAQPDIVSLARINDRAGEDQLFCTNRPLLLPQLTVQRGNVQVH
ncbi:MAG: hypothetical protein WD825_01475 [Gemmatimonadaceae bacterium]